MRFVILAALATSVLLATPAGAASPIVTPALQPSNAGTLACWVVNASDTKPLEVQIEIRSFEGDAVESASGTVVPGGANAISSTDDEARFCVVRVTSGGRKNAIVSAVALEGGAPVAVVAAQR